MDPKHHSSSDLGFDRSRISGNALDVVRQLQSAGYDGYLVGGCVRDLLLGLKPKDFDVTTNASPEQVKRIFGKARIIGRRFRLVHVPFGRGRQREIIEVATYRAGSQASSDASPKSSSKGRILDDNVYGTMDADAARRDFTINSIYYDPVNEIVVDFLDGIEHALSRRLEVIGDPAERFREDPVRMLRVVRFQAKLGLSVSDSILKCIDKQASLMADVPPARLFDEVLKLFHHTAAERTWKALRKTRLLEFLFPLTVRCINDAGGKNFESLILSALANTDRRITEGKPVIAGFLYAVLLWKPYCERLEKIMASPGRKANASWNAADDVFSAQNRSVSIPYRVRTPAHEIWEMQIKLERRVPRTIRPILDNRRFRAGYDFLCLRQAIGEVDESTVSWWTRIQDCSDSERTAMIDELRKNAGNSNRRRRRKKGKGGSRKAAGARQG